MLPQYIHFGCLFFWQPHSLFCRVGWNSCACWKSEFIGHFYWCSFMSIYNVDFLNIPNTVKILCLFVSNKWQSIQKYTMMPECGCSAHVHFSQKEVYHRKDAMHCFRFLGTWSALLNVWPATWLILCSLNKNHIKTKHLSKISVV